MSQRRPSARRARSSSTSATFSRAVRNGIRCASCATSAIFGRAAARRRAIAAEDASPRLPSGATSPARTCEQRRLARARGAGDRGQAAAAERRLDVVEHAAAARTPSSAPRTSATTRLGARRRPRARARSPAAAAATGEITMPPSSTPRPRAVGDAAAGAADPPAIAASRRARARSPRHGRARPPTPR